MPVFPPRYLLLSSNNSRTTQPASGSSYLSSTSSSNVPYSAGWVWGVLYILLMGLPAYCLPACQATQNRRESNIIQPFFAIIYYPYKSCWINVHQNKSLGHFLLLCESSIENNLSPPTDDKLTNNLSPDLCTNKSWNSASKQTAFLMMWHLNPAWWHKGHSFKNSKIPKKFDNSENSWFG